MSTPKPDMMELRVQLLLRNGLTSKSGMTLADTEVLTEIAKRLGYDEKVLKKMDITDGSVNPYRDAVIAAQPKRTKKVTACDCLDTRDAGRCLGKQLNTYIGSFADEWCQCVCHIPKGDRFCQKCGEMNLTTHTEDDCKPFIYRKKADNGST